MVITVDTPWKLEELMLPPSVYPAPALDNGHVKAIFYDGPVYQKRNTRIFAYYGFPQTEINTAEPVPAVVLVHGGAGTAFAHWVQLWNERGYAAIAMDLEGHMPGPCVEPGVWPGHPWSGPAKLGVFGDYREPVQDQWMYHAVAAVVLAHSLIRSFAGVDKERIGITGISWGGIITSLVSGLDSRFCFAVPVYGCGYLYEPGTLYGNSFAAMDEIDAARIRRLWDPSRYLPQSRLPMLWLNGSNDTHFPLDIFIRSYELQRKASQQSVLSIQPGLGHSHDAGWACEEIFAFADAVTGRKLPLPRVGAIVREGRRVLLPIESNRLVEHATLYWCERWTAWRTAQWVPVAARVRHEAGKQVVEAELPDEQGLFFIHVTDGEGLSVSTVIFSREIIDQENIQEHFKIMQKGARDS